MGWGKERGEGEAAASLRTWTGSPQLLIRCAAPWVTAVDKTAFTELTVWGWRWTLNKSLHRELFNYSERPYREK